MSAMSWFVVRLPGIEGVGVVPETALDYYRGRGWLRVSEALDEDGKDQVERDLYADAPDLDAEDQPAEPETEPEPEQPADTTEE